jgi:hypothetical protein
MTNDTGLLNDTELAAVSGGGGLITLATRTIALPHIPQAKDLLTPDQIAKLLTPSFNLPITRG